MSRRQRFALVCGILAAAACVVFFAISIDPGVYSPGAQDIHWHYLDHLRDTSPPKYAHELNIFFLVRKAYSVIAFSIVGLLAAPALPKRRRVVLDGIAVGAFSTIIEIGQRLADLDESLRSNLFDIACGVLGGVIGALAWNVARGLTLRRTSR